VNPPHRHQYRFDTPARGLLACWGCEQKWPLVPTDPAELAAAVYRVAHDIATDDPAELAGLYDRLRYQEGDRAWDLWLDAAGLDRADWEHLVGLIHRPPTDDKEP
jgi:hypothetical protein